MEDTIKEIVERSRKDPNFLYQLVFNPSDAVKGLRLTDEELDGACRKHAGTTNCGCHCTAGGLRKLADLRGNLHCDMH